MSSLSFLAHENGRCRNPKNQPSDTVEVVSDQEHLHHSAMTIENLPMEILQEIARLLAPDSAACFILCSKSLQRAIGHQSWLNLRAKDQKNARLSFLDLLQRDQRERLLCYHCEKLYSFNLEPYSYTPWRFHNEHPCDFADGCLYLLPLFSLRFQYAQMIMKLHRLGAKENIFLDSLSRPYSSIYNGHVSHSHTSARITNDELLVKLEWRILLHRGDELRISSLCRNICPHWNSVLDDEKLSKRVRCQTSHPGKSCSECAEMIPCRFCSTELFVAFLDSNWSPGGQAIYITAWKNLGPCVTPLETRWKSHLWLIYSSLPSPTSSATFVPGSIRKAFEDVTDSRIRVDGLSRKWPLDSDFTFSRLVTDNQK